MVDSGQLLELDNLCEGASELSAEDEPDEYIEDNEIEVDHTVICDNDISGQSSTLDTSARSNSSHQFSILLSLNLAFIKVNRPDSEKIDSKCTFCSKVLKTRENSRLVNHAKKCPKMDTDVLAQINEEYKDKKLRVDSSRDLLIGRMIAECNLAFTFLEEDSFIKFCKSFDPNYRPPSRKQISTHIIPTISGQLEKKFLHKLKKGCRISVEFDHWSDKKRTDLLAVVVTFMDGSQYLVGLKDTSIEGHSARKILFSLKDLLSSVDKKAINSIVSDSASSCKKTRELIVEEAGYRHIIQHRCLPHFLNRIGQHFSSSAKVKEALDWAVKLTGLISNDSKLLAKFKEAGKRRVAKACKVRWYSYVNMVESLIDVKLLLLQEARNQDRTMKNLIIDTEKWSTIREASLALKPLAECIGHTERKDASLGEGISHLLELGKQLFEADLYNPTIRDAIVSFVTYFGRDKLKDELKLFLAAYMLNRRSGVRYLTQKAIDLALEAIIAVAKSINVSPEELKSNIVPEFSKYSLLMGDYGEPVDDSENIIDWWLRRADSEAFAEVALKFAYLRASSANIERTFSTMRYIQGLWRLNMDNETLMHLARCRISKQEIDTLPDDHEMLDEPYNDSDNEDCDCLTLGPLPSRATITSQVPFQPIEQDVASFFADLSSRKLVQEYIELIDYSVQVEARKETQTCSGVEVTELLHASQEFRRALS